MNIKKLVLSLAVAVPLAFGRATVMDTAIIPTVASANHYDDAGNEYDDNNNLVAEARKVADSKSGRDSNNSTDDDDSIIPTRLPTGFSKGMAKAKNSSKGDTADTSKLDKTIRAVVNAHDNDSGRILFGNVGAIYGPTNADGGTKGVQNTLSASTARLKTATYGGPGGSGAAYLTFGNAVDNLRSQAASSNASSISTNDGMNALSGLSGVVAGMGINTLKVASPVPLMNAFIDFRTINSADQNNFFIQWLKGNQFFLAAARTTGSLAPGTSVPMSFFIFAVIGVFLMAIAALGTIFGEKAFMREFKRMMVKLLVIALAIPIGANLFQTVLNIGSDLTSNVKNNRKIQLIRENLNLGDWARSNFGLPKGMSLTVKDRAFVLSQDDIEKINLYTAYQQGDLTASEYNNGNPSDKAKAYVGKKIIDYSGRNDNSTDINWHDLTRSKGREYSTKDLDAVASALAGNKELGKGVDVDGIGYLNQGSLTASRVSPIGDNDTLAMNGTYTMTGNNAYGLSPIARWNLLNTDFSNKSFQVHSNLDAPHISYIAANADTYRTGPANASTPTAAPPLVGFVINLTMIGAAFRALAKIFASGIGGALKGGARAAAGSAAGAGEWIGGLLALGLGVIGLAAVITMVNGVIDLLWTGISSIMNGALSDVPFIGAFSSMIPTVSKWPLIGRIVARFLKSVIQLVMVILSLLFLPRMVKIPLNVFGTYMSELPQRLGDRFRNMETAFVRMSRGMSRRGRGRRGAGSMMSQIRQAGKMSAAGSKAFRAGAATMAGLRASKLNSIFNKGKDTERKDSEKTRADGSEVNNDSTDSALTDQTALEQQSAEEKQSQEHASDEQSTTDLQGSDDHSATNTNGTNEQSVIDNPGETIQGSDEHSATDTTGLLDADNPDLARSAGDAVPGEARSSESVANGGTDTPGASDVPRATDVPRSAGDQTSIASDRTVHQEGDRTIENAASDGSDINNEQSVDKSVADNAMTAMDDSKEQSTLQNSDVNNSQESSVANTNTPDRAKASNTANPSVGEMAQQQGIQATKARTTAAAVRSAAMAATLAKRAQDAKNGKGAPRHAAPKTGVLRGRPRSVAQRIRHNRQKAKNAMMRQANIVNANGQRLTKGAVSNREKFRVALAQMGAGVKLATRVGTGTDEQKMKSTQFANQAANHVKGRQKDARRARGPGVIPHSQVVANQLAAEKPVDYNARIRFTDKDIPTSIPNIPAHQLQDPTFRKNYVAEMNKAAGFVPTATPVETTETRQTQANNPAPQVSSGTQVTEPRDVTDASE